MSLLDDKWGQLKAYIEANTPKNTRPAVSPAKVIDQGLINPNKYTAPSANNFKDSALGLLGVVPGVGDVASGVQAADYWNRGEKGNAMLAGLGALPLVPAIGGMFIGKGAKTWDALKAQQADESLKAGADPRKVWSQTGTARFPDGMLRQEIPDNAAYYDPDALSELKFGDSFNYKSDTAPLAGVVGHKELFSAYPDMENIPVHFMPKEKLKEAYGAYSGKHDRLTLADSPKDQKSGALHELQHAIQQREGWAKGGSPDQMRQDLAGGELTGLYSQEELNNAYRRLAGEAEARLTQSRMNMTMSERLASYPPDMFDVPVDQQIVRGLLGGPALSYTDEAKKAKK